MILTSKLNMVTTIFVNQESAIGIAIQDDGEVELSMFVPPFSYFQHRISDVALQHKRLQSSVSTNRFFDPSGCTRGARTAT